VVNSSDLGVMMLVLDDLGGQICCCTPKPLEFERAYMIRDY